MENARSIIRKLKVSERGRALLYSMNLFSYTRWGGLEKMFGGLTKNSMNVDICIERYVKYLHVFKVSIRFIKYLKSIYMYFIVRV